MSPDKKTVYCLVLGGYINGYSIIRELYSHDLRNIALFTYGRNVAEFSNKVRYKRRIDRSAEALKEAIFELKKQADYIVIYPTDDIQIEFLHAVRKEIEPFCFLPFNSDNILESQDKEVQYEYCEKLGVPYPKTLYMHAASDIEKLAGLIYPILLKPAKRLDLVQDVFRSLFLESVQDLEENRSNLERLLGLGVSLLASEYIPGDDTQIYGYMGYRSKSGDLLNEWGGKKLTQYPDNFGTFCSASNQCPPVVFEQGRTLLEGMNLMGITEPEFKYDHRDGKYKLMEINLRSMMWNRMGNLSGVYLQYTQYLDALGLPVPRYEQDQSQHRHFLYMKYEVLNLLSRKNYWPFFKYNVFGGDRVGFATFAPWDIKPFVFSALTLVKCLLNLCLKPLKAK